MKHLNKIFNRLFKPRAKYAPLIQITIFKDRILYNLETYQKTYPKLQIAPVLKSNAYGHGMIEVAKILDGKGLPFFAVDSFHEALTLRQNRIKNDLLVIGYTTIEQLNGKKLPACSYTIVSYEQLKTISARLKHGQKFHIKIDTGMCRQGILPEQIESAFSLIKANPKIEIEGFCSHFSDAESSDDSFTLKQIDAWNALLPKLKAAWPKAKYWHISASAGLKFYDKIEANLLRLGAGLYGLNESPAAGLPLAPTLRMSAKISGIKIVPAGSEIGYSRTHVAQNEMRLATVPAGYYEGVDRRLSDIGKVKIRDFFCPIVGRVSMNITTVDVSRIPDLQLEEEAVLISENEQDDNSVANIAKSTGAIKREILIHVAHNLRRRVSN
ncbi:alanine racemase [Candidatus Peregrinibacteria bacterium]|nr:alanine racemase [Candidatus Peregrinibacteria bacterium]